MEMRTRLFAEQRRDGRTAADLAGSGDFGPSYRVSKVKGRFTMEWRLQAHIHRVFGSSSLLSYKGAASSAHTALELYLKKVTKEELPPAQSRSTAMLHDERFHWCATRPGRRESPFGLIHQPEILFAGVSGSTSASSCTRRRAASASCTTRVRDERSRTTPPRSSARALMAAGSSRYFEST